MPARSGSCTTTGFWQALRGPRPIPSRSSRGSNRSWNNTADSSSGRPSSWPRTGARIARFGAWKPCSLSWIASSCSCCRGRATSSSPTMESWASDRADRSPWRPHGRCPGTARSRSGSSRRKRWRLPPASASTPTPTSWSRSSEAMPISLPERMQLSADALTPRQIVGELDKYVVGQHNAKRAVAIALRNRTRRQKRTPELAEDVAPKNILMIGPTGVGKTEIARRLARLAQSPFIKVEASKFTEVGYVGRDVESMVRDLVELAVDMVRAEKAEEVKDKARDAAEERLLDLLLPPSTNHLDVVDPAVAGLRDPAQHTRERLREQLRAGRLDHRSVEIDVRDQSFPSFEIISGSSVEEVGINLKEMMPGMFGGRSRKRKLKVPEALEQVTQEEEQKLIDMDSVARTAVQRVEQGGIIFVDEIDKIAGREGGQGPDVSREGVQRDILPIVEGTT